MVHCHDWHTGMLPYLLKGRIKTIFTIHNAEERIVLSSLKSIKESFQVDFPNFHSFLRFKINSKKEIIIKEEQPKN